MPVTSPCFCRLPVPASSRKPMAVLATILFVATSPRPGAAQQMKEQDASFLLGVGHSEQFRPLVRPGLTVCEAGREIRVDGELDERAWQSANWVSSFSEMWPGNRTKPQIEMKAGVTYDNDNLYVAFKVYDDPAQIRTTLTDRDKMWYDDYVAILLDTYGDGGWAYLIASNPIGVQGDLRTITGTSEDDESFDIVYSSEGKVTETGYQVEMAIPFRSLRFPAGAKQSWRANLQVSHPRDTRRVYTWSAIDRDDACMICQYGTVSGIENVTPGGGYELLPALVGSQSAELRDVDNPRTGIDNHKATIEPSLGIKYSLNSNLIGDLALNPDFSQVESDAAQIDVNESFALFLPEKRPFFQEGSDLYQTPIQTVYTRSINNPSAAGKLTGRFGQANFGYIGASDLESPVIIPLEESSEFVSAGRSYSNIGRFKRAFSGGSNIGAQITDRRYEGGGGGSTAGVDAQVRISRSLQLYGHLVASHTAEPEDETITRDIEGIDTLTFDRGRHTVAFDGETFSGHAAQLGLTRHTRRWSFDANYRATSPTFRADNGFVTQTNRQRFSTWQNYSFWPQNGFFKQIRPHTTFSLDLDYEGRRRDIYFWLGALIRTKGQTQLIFSRMILNNEVFAGHDFRGMQRTWVYLESNFSSSLGLVAEAEFGEWVARGEDIPVMGTGGIANLGATLKPWSQLVLEPAIAYSRLESKETGESLFDGYVLRIRANLQATRRLVFRLITQYDRFDKHLEIDPLVTYRVNPFTAFYVGSTHDYRDFDDFEGRFEQTARQFFFKVQYLVRS